MQSGRSVRLCTSGIAERISSTSSARGSPTLTSSMSAPPATCCATSTSIRERSPFCSSAWNFLRPVGLIRSPITQNARSGPMTTVLDGDSRTVSTQFPLCSGWDAEAAAQVRNTRLSAKADQVQAAHPRQQTGCVGELAGELEALGLGVGVRARSARSRRRARRCPAHARRRTAAPPASGRGKSTGGSRQLAPARSRTPPA